jgi:tetratricopeptide (TPR) repeat protein
MAASIGFVITAILMTGTRSALMAMWILLFVVVPVAAWRCRGQLAAGGWARGAKLIALGFTLGTVLVLGVIPSGNSRIVDEGHGATAIQRGIYRTESIGPKDYSLGVRMVMWRATLTMIKARPLSGVGAGAWENDIPLYQAEGSQLETDYYAHNEFLQLVAEYGLVGWIFLLALAAYLLQATWRTWRAASPPADADRPWRAAMLASLLALMIVSNIGFPWRLASTGALFALCLGGLAACDARSTAWLARPLRWSPRVAHACLAASGACLALALYITQRAATAEHDLVFAAKTALAITATGEPNNPRYAEQKREMLDAVRHGIELNRHYRKITPMVADELARWGDWKDATWIWESVLSSRPYVVAILTNVARGYSSIGQPRKALEYLQRAKRLQPDAPAVRSLEVLMLARSGQEAKALALARASIAEGIEDYDLVNALFILEWRAHDLAGAERAMQERMRKFPESRAQGYAQLGLVYADVAHDEARALAAFRAGLQATPAAERGAYMQQVPPAFRPKLGSSSP